MHKIIRILFILSSISIIIGQTPEELKRFMQTYDKLKVDQEANEIVKKGIESEKDPRTPRAPKGLHRGPQDKTQM